MTISKAQAIIIAVVLVLAAIFAGLFFINPDKDAPVELSVWGVEPQEYFTDALSKHKELFPHVTTRYTQVPRDEYENTLINALATGKGPDIAMFHRSWLMRQGDKLSPATNEEISTRQLQEFFPDVVAKDFVYQNSVYALPLYIDTLALYYNKDVFNNKGILYPPRTWDDLRLMTPNLVTVNLANQLTRPAVALGGTTKSIFNAPDILTLLLVQYADPDAKNRYADYYLQTAAQRGMEYYLQFSNPTSRYYSWQDSMEDSLSQFSAGSLAMTFDYSDKIKAIKNASPYLNFAVAAMPQYDDSRKVNYADYWGLAVMAQSPNGDAAWQFVKNFTTDPNISFAYLNSSGHPPALKRLITQYKDDPMMSVFANQTITADSVFQYDIEKFREAMSGAIASVLSGRLDVSRALQEAGGKIRR